MGQKFQAPCAEAGFLHQFAVGRVEQVLARLHQALGYRHLVVAHAAAEFFDQHHAALILHGYHHHRAIALATVDQAFIGALDAVAETQLHLLDGKQATLGDDLRLECFRQFWHCGLRG